MNNAPLIVIVGPTASGKSSLAMEIAQQFNGEIICADSRTIYKGMDIGTAKPSADDRTRVPHWGLDLVEPGERFTAADFKKYTYAAIDNIRARGKVPLLVGGTGLYVEGVIFDYQFGQTDMLQRKQLEGMSIEELVIYCDKNNIELPENTKNKRYLVRAVEQGGVNKQRSKEIIDNTIVVGISTDRDVLRKRIEDRAEQLFADGMIDEAVRLGKAYGWESEAMTGNAYPLVRQYLDGDIDEKELRYRFSIADWQLAKRQMTYLRRNPCVQWHQLDDAKKYLTKYLSSVIL